ncbi:MAG: lytic transglycosylase domain-containing protein, partial [Pseudomonadota bacterium]
YNYLNDRKQFNALTAAQTDRVRGWIAANYYYNGNIRKAQQVANQALRRSSDSAVLSHWINGLIAWRQENYSRAYKAFSAQASIPYQENDLRAAAAFWAARGALATGKVDDIDRHLALAAGYPLTFYGQLALGQLGLDPDLDWTPPALTTEGLQKLYAQSPKVERAAALAQVGRTQDAEVELKWAQGEVTREDDVTLIALSYAVGLPSAALSIALQAGADAPERSHLQAGLYPDPSYAPNNGFTVDKAVLYGLIRQESKFMPMARSRVGARGLMQLMPRTASYVAGDGHRSGQLYDPGYNMQLGQSYVEQLLTKYNGKRGDLFEMALSYNWGPGNYHRWQAKTGITDQLLMLESVPNPEARHFVETVLTNIWVYRDRFDEPAPSRDRAAAGKRPVYESVY